MEPYEHLAKALDFIEQSLNKPRCPRCGYRVEFEGDLCEMCIAHLSEAQQYGQASDQTTA